MHSHTFFQSRESYGLVKQRNWFAILHAKQSVDKAICLCHLCPWADTVLCQTSTEGVWDSDGSCVCVYVWVSTYVPVMYIHTWMPICIVLDLMNANVFYSCVCVCLTECVCVCVCVCLFVCDSECVYSQKNALGSLFLLFLSLFSDTQSDDIILFWIKRRSKPAGDSSILLTRLLSSTSQ